MQENVGNLLVEAGTLLLVGMIVVFVFLTLLIVAIKLIAKVCSYFPESIAPGPAQPAQASTSVSQSGAMSPSLVAAISAAVHQYRKTR